MKGTFSQDDINRRKAPAWKAGAFRFARPARTAARAGPAGGWVLRLFGRGHFFGFAFLAHEFEFAFGFFVGGLYFLLDLLGRFYELW
jgi:hypothetical protein